MLARAKDAIGCANVRNRFAFEAKMQRNSLSQEIFR